MAPLFFGAQIRVRELVCYRVKNQKETLKFFVLDLVGFHVTALYSPHPALLALLNGDELLGLDLSAAFGPP